MTSTKPAAFAFDSACALSRGARDYQEDALIADLSRGNALSFAVLADGMGGHAAGDIASKIVVTEMFTALTFMREEMVACPDAISGILREAADTANAMLKAHVERYPETHGMGATLVATVLVGDELHWISIGDSPLYLFRDNRLVQLNADHSMATTIDAMVATGVLSAEEGANHPDRNVLTSVLFGAPIPEVDCPSQPTKLCAGDTLIVASDGLQFLSNAEIEVLLRARPLSGSHDIAEGLMSALMKLNDPDLDNVSFSIIQVRNRPGATLESPVTSQDKPSLLSRVFKSPSSHEVSYDR